MNLKEPFVITISREIGSGGHTVGRILADKLKTFYFDKFLIESLEKKFNLSASGIEKLKGEKKNWLADFIKFLSPLPSSFGPDYGRGPALYAGVPDRCHYGRYI